MNRSRTVSYTHLDVYKRQLLTSPVRKEPGPEAVAETIPADEEAWSADELAAYLSAGRTPYIGSPFQDQALFGRLPVPEKLVYEKMELQTSEEPYELRMIYRVKDGSCLLYTSRCV